MKPKIWIGILVIIAALVFLLVGSFKEAAVYYLTISELRSKTDLPAGEGLRISGNVVPTSIDWNADKIELRFALYDAQDTINVFYKGTMPDQLGDAQLVVVEGLLAHSDTLYAGKILLKCPSKYETSTPEEHVKNVSN